MANLTDFAPTGRGGLGGLGGELDLRMLLLLAQAPDMLGGLPKVQTPEPTYNPSGGFEGGATSGLDMAKILEMAQGFRGNPAGRNPAVEGAYQSQRAGERMPFQAPTGEVASGSGGGWGAANAGGLGLTTLFLGSLLSKLLRGTKAHRAPGAAGPDDPGNVGHGGPFTF